MRQPFTTWTLADELKLEELVTEHEFLHRLPYRFGYGPLVRAPWEVRPVDKSGAQERGDK